MPHCWLARQATPVLQSIGPYPGPVSETVQRILGRLQSLERAEWLIDLLRPHEAFRDGQFSVEVVDPVYAIQGCYAVRYTGPFIHRGCASAWSHWTPRESPSSSAQAPSALVPRRGVGYPQTSSARSKSKAKPTSVPGISSGSTQPSNIQVTARRRRRPARSASGDVCRSAQ
jgi:hypothetical protein